MHSSHLYTSHPVARLDTIQPTLGAEAVPGSVSQRGTSCVGESVEQALPKGSEPDGRRLRTGRTGGAGLHDYQKYNERFRKISTFHLRKVPLLLVVLLL